MSTIPLAGLSLARLRARFDALPVDRAPLRRAGLLTLLLVALLLVSRALVPAGGERNGPPAAERFSADAAGADAAAPRPAPRRSGGLGALGALGLLAVGGVGGAVLARRRAPGAAAPRASALTVLESHTVAPGQSLRLVSVGGEVLLLSVASDGARVLRTWPAADAPASAGPLGLANALAADDAPAADDLSPEPGRLFPAPSLAPATVPAAPADAPSPARPSPPAFADVLRQFHVADV